MPSFNSQISYDYQRVRQVTDTLSGLMSRYGYEPFEIPIIELADLFLTKAGDQIIRKLFTFERHGQELALRPEFTAPAAYYYGLLGDSKTPIVRWQFNGPVFEDDPDDVNRNYQRYSIGAELIGLAGSTADAELIGMAAQGIQALGVADSTPIVGNAGLTRRLLSRFNLDSRLERFLLNHLVELKDSSLGKRHVLERIETIFAPGTPLEEAGRTFSTEAEHDASELLNSLLDGFSGRAAAMGGRTRAEIARRLLDKRKRVFDHNRISLALDFLERWVAIDAPPEEAFAAMQALVSESDETARQHLLQWKDTVDLLPAYGIARVRIQPALARSWEYYTGVVFEIYGFDGLRLCGGGRYDELIHLIGARENVPAVGFAYYADQLVLALPPVSNPRQRIVVAFEERQRLPATGWAHQLRAHGLVAVLLPAGADTYKAGDSVLSIIDSDRASVGDAIYTLAQIDSLVAKLAGAKR